VYLLWHNLACSLGSVKTEYNVSNMCGTENWSLIALWDLVEAVLEESVVSDNDKGVFMLGSRWQSIAEYLEARVDEGDGRPRNPGYRSVGIVGVEHRIELIC